MVAMPKMITVRPWQGWISDFRKAHAILVAAGIADPRLNRSQVIANTLRIVGTLSADDVRWLKDGPQFEESGKGA
jgi:hypothetical protein